MEQQGSDRVQKSVVALQQLAVVVLWVKVLRQSYSTNVAVAVAVSWAAAQEATMQWI